MPIHLRTAVGAGALFLMLILASERCIAAQVPAGTPDKKNGAAKQPAGPESAPEPPVAQVDVAPRASDQEIADRLRSILEATEWFIDPTVEVREGVVFLGGRTATEQRRKWAGDLGRSTEDVVAVVNQIDLTQPSVFDFSEAWAGLRGVWSGFVRGLPWLMFSVFVLIVAYVAAHFTRKILRHTLRSRIHNVLLRNVAAFAGGLFVFLAGMYLLLRIAGLTQLALTLLGGTGVVGIVLGIGFRDITENFLASILLSLQNPFRTGDLVDIGGAVGYVERMTVRSTVLATGDGNQLQIPNATVYKSTILNFTSTPNRRESFTIGVGYDVQIQQAQQVALEVLGNHPAVLEDPEPWVLVEGLGAASVNLRVYFWLNGREHSWLKVKSSVIRLIKRAFQDRGITIPDEARERLFPREVPVRLLESVQVPTGPAPVAPPKPLAGEPTTTEAEGGLASDAEELKQLAQQSQLPDTGENLLAPPNQS